MNKKIALVCIELDNDNVKNEFTPPFGLLTAATVIQNNGWAVTIHHLITKKGFENLLFQLAKGVDAIGFSVMTSPNLNAVLKASSLLTERGYTVFWGGTHPTLLPKISLMDSVVSIVLRGESESTIPSFLAFLEGKKDLKDVPGACFKQEDGTFYLSPIPVSVLDQDIVGHSFDLIDISSYLHRGEHILINNQGIAIKNVLPIVTSRGCQFTCAFCYNQSVHGSSWRSLSLQRIFFEMDFLLSKYDIGGWYFYDDNFFRDSDRAWSILERYRLPSFVEVHVSKINDAFIKRALKAGISRLYIGGETGSDKLLKRIRKATTISRIRKAVLACSQAGLPVSVSMMIFMPGETLEEIELTLKLKNDFEKLPHVTVDGPKVFNPYPGTDFYQQMVCQGWSPPGNNKEWASFTRNMDPVLAGYPLTRTHKDLLQKYNITNIIN